MKKLLFSLLLLGCISGSRAQGKVNFTKYTISPASYAVVLPYENINNKLVVTVQVKGKPHRFIFDTGASNIITEKVKELTDAPVVATLPVRDAGGKRVPMTMVKMPSYTIDSLVLSDVLSLVTTDAGLFSCFEAEGLLGSNMFARSVVRIDSRSNSLLITSDPTLAGVKPELAQPMVTDQQFRPFVWVNFTPDIRQQVLFDTGDSKLYSMSNNNYKKLKKYKVFSTLSSSFGSSSYSLHGRDSSAVIHRLQIPTLSIGKGVLTNADVLTTVDADTRMGTKLLEYGVVTLDFINRQFYFEPFDSIANVNEKRWSISPTYAGDQLVVGHVWDEQLRQQVAVGDQILTIDGIEAASLPVCDLYTGKSVLSDKTKTQFICVIRNAAGEERSVTIQKM